MKKLDETASLMLGGTDKVYEEIIRTNLDERRIVFNDQVDSNILENICLWILRWNKDDKNIPIEERKKIFIYTNSPGGDVFTGLNLCDVIKSSKTPIVGICMAYGYSMGAVIFSATHERIMFENSSLLIHDGNTNLSVTAGKVKDLQAFYNRIDLRLKQVILDNSNITSEEYDSVIDRELYMLADECKAKGLCDKIIGIDCDLDYIL